MMNWRIATLFLVLVGCGKSMQDSADSTLYAGDLILNVHSSDLSLNKKLQGEFKSVAKPFLKKPYRVDVDLNQESSVMTANITISDRSNRVACHKQLKLNQSLDEDHIYSSIEAINDASMKGLALRIAQEVDRLA